MKNNKGFTLIEILAVIVILAVVIGLAVPAIGAMSKRTKQKMYDSKIDMILAAAKEYGEDNRSSINTDCNKSSLSGYKCLEITVSDLLDEGYLTADQKDNSNNPIITDPRDNNSINNTIITVYIKNNRIYSILGQNLFHIENAYFSNLNGNNYINIDTSGLGKKMYYITTNTHIDNRISYAYDETYAFNQNGNIIHRTYTRTITFNGGNAWFINDRHYKIRSLQIIVPKSSCSSNYICNMADLSRVNFTIVQAD